MKRRRVNTSIKQELLTPDELETLVGVNPDIILDRFGKPKRIKTLGKDSEGFVVVWFYKNFKLTFVRANTEDPVHHKVTSSYVVSKSERR